MKFENVGTFIRAVMLTSGRIFVAIGLLAAAKQHKMCNEYNVRESLNNGSLFLFQRGENLTYAVGNQKVGAVIVRRGRLIDYNERDAFKVIYKSGGRIYV